jgi:hypothetical protein
MQRTLFVFALVSLSLLFLGMSARTGEPALNETTIVENEQTKEQHDTEVLLELADSVFSNINKELVDTYVERFEKQNYEERREKYKTIYFNMFIDDGYSPLEAFVFSEIPSVESSYLSHVKSPAGAGGQWQLMPSTARGYGLTVSQSVDERTDPLLAYEASERYIRNLKKTANGNIVRILYGYNGGPGRALKGARIPLETRHFAAKVYASLIRFEQDL